MRKPIFFQFQASHFGIQINQKTFGGKKEQGKHWFSLSRKTCEIPSKSSGRKSGTQNPTNGIKKVPKPQRCNGPFANVSPNMLRERTLGPRCTHFGAKGAHLYPQAHVLAPFFMIFGWFWHWTSLLQFPASHLDNENQYKLNCRELATNFQQTGINKKRSPRNFA